MSSQQSGEGDIRRKMVEDDVVDCMVALPGQLFYSTQIPACLWFLARDKSANGHRDRRGEILFIDARKLGRMVDRTRREFSAEDIEKITYTYHRWRSKTEHANYKDEPGFCASVRREKIANEGSVLTPGRYVGTEDAEDDASTFEERFSGLTATLQKQFEASRQLENKILSALARTTDRA
jgi:type I restriction enzyme M protein